MRTRLIDISRETGFSVNTISLALKESSRISAETRGVIAKTASRLHYVPNGMARSLVTNENNTVGVIVRSLKSPVLVEMVGHIEEYLRQNGYYTIIMSAREDITQRVDALLVQNVCGMLIYPDLLEIDFEKFRYLRSIDFPFVFMSSDGKIDDLDTVYMDRRVGGYKAAAHLAALGHKKIGFISGDKVKMEGYRQALAEYGLPFDERLIIAARDHRCQAGYDAFAELYERHTGLSALFCITDSYAIGAAKYCRERGLKIPEDIAIVGYDNLEEAGFGDVPITTISYDLQKETQMAVALLRKRIGERSSQVKPESIALEPELIIRESTVKKEVHVEQINNP